jgi:hypothetical protein
MARAVEFLGRLYFSPGSRGAFRAKPQPAGQSPDFTTLILIGSSQNGWSFKGSNLRADQRVMEFGNADEAVAVLGKNGGDLMDAIANCFPPSQDQRFIGPQLIKAINVSNNTNASAQAETNIPGNQLQVRAIVPGTRGNTIRYRISGGGTTVQIGDASDISTSPNLNSPEISVQYLGDATEAILYIDQNHFRITLSGDQTDSTQSLDIPVRDYQSIGELVDFINSRPGYQAVVISRPDRRTEFLDHIQVAENVDVKTLTVCNALFHEQQRYMRSSGLAEIAIPIGMVKKPLADMLNFTYLEGGNSTVPTPTDWIDAVNYVYDQKVEGFFLSLCTDSLPAGLHLADKVGFGNSPDGSFEKFATSGLDTEKSILERIEDCKMVNSEFVGMGFSPVVVRRADRVETKRFSGWMIGVIHNAIKASANLRETPTYKDLNIIECPEIYRDSVLRRIVQAGGMAVDRKPNRGAWKIHFALTSFQKENIILNQTSIVCTALGLVKDFREWLDATFLAEVPTDPDAIGSGLTDADIRSAVDNRFRDTYIAQYGWLTRNIYTGEDAFDSRYTIRRDGDAIYFQFPNGNLVSPINFMFFLMNLDVVRGSSNG